MPVEANWKFCAKCDDYTRHVGVFCMDCAEAYGVTHLIIGKIVSERGMEP